MKYYNKLLLAVGALFLVSCAEEFDPRQIDVDKPQNIAQYEYLNEYDVLKSYVDRTANPNFKVGAGVDVGEFLKKELVYSAAVSNFDEVVAGNAMKYASIVGNDGSMNFSNVRKFVAAAEEAELSIYGHTLLWHAQQNTKYLNGLIAPVIVPGESGGAGYALKMTNESIKGNVWESQTWYTLPGGPLTNGTSYTYTFMVKATEAYNLQVYMQSSTGGAQGYPGGVSVTKEWSEVSLTIKPSHDQVDRLAFNFGTLAGTIWVDNVSLTAPGSDVNLIANGDFEAANIDGWSGWSPYGSLSENGEGYSATGGTKMVEQLVNNGFEEDDRTNYQANGQAQLSYTADGEGVEGRAVKITNPAVQPNGYNAQFIVKWDPVMADGEVYEFSVDIRADRNVTIGTQAQRSAGTYLGGYIGNIDLTTEWKTVTSKLVVNGMGAIAFDLGLNDTNYYFDNLSLKKEEISGGDRPLEEKKEILTNELERWIAGMMEATEGYVKAWDVVNEPMDDGNPYALKSDPKGEKPSDFYWQDYLGKDYVRDAVRFARQYGGNDLLLFANDYNLEAVYNNNDKARGLIAMVEYWESDGVTKIDGIGTQMHISYNMNATQQKKQEEAIVTMFELLAATGKLIKVTELDMGINDVNGNPINTADVTFEQHQAMAAFYKFIVKKYFEIIPAAQRYGITQWAQTDNPSSSGWRANQPIGLWDANYNRKPAYGGFADGLAGN